MKIKGIVKTVTAPKEWNGVLQIGFVLDGANTWYNIPGDQEVLTEIQKLIKKGNEIDFEYDQEVKGISNVTVLTESKKEGNWAEDMTNFEDLLSAAHKAGLISITTEMMDIDVEKQFVIFKATITGRINETIGTFTGYGDAEGISNEKIKIHWIRMAETRSIVRALRWYTNNASVAEEETD